MNLDFYDNLINKDASAIFDDTDNILWVDWRESEDEIVSSLSAMLRLEDLTVTHQDDENEHGYKVVITYDGNSVSVNPAGGLDMRHATLNAVDSLVSPDFEVRYATDSEGGDSIGIAAEHTNDWKTLYRIHGKLINERFCPVRELPDLMNTRPTEIREACQKYANRIG